MLIKITEWHLWDYMKRNSEVVPNTNGEVGYLPKSEEEYQKILANLESVKGIFNVNSYTEKESTQFSYFMPLCQPYFSFNYKTKVVDGWDINVFVVNNKDNKYPWFMIDMATTVAVEAKWEDIYKK